MASTENSRRSTAQCHRQQNGKGRTQLTSTTWQRRAGSASTSARQRLERRPDRMSPHWLKWLQRQQAEFPRPSRAAFKRALYDTPSSRQEVEESERLRWLQALALLVERSPTPMGNLLARQPCSLALLGAGRRAATLRNRVRLLRNYFSWLTATHEVSYPASLEHFVGFLGARASEPAIERMRNVNRTFKLPPRGDRHRTSGSSNSDASLQCSLQGDFGEL